MRKEIKKLALGKMTLTNLNISEMSQMVGGISGGCNLIEKKPSKKP